MTNDLSYILYVEDSKLEIMRFKMALETNQYTNKVEIAMNGEEGLTFLNKNRHHLPKIIVLDLKMPIMNGLEFLEQIKKDPTLQRIPTIILTTSENEKDIEKCYHYQIAGYFAKPFGMKAYNTMVERIITYWRFSRVILS